MAGPGSVRVVLVVDDEVAIALVLADALEEEGLHTLVAHDGREALDAVRIHHPQLVLTDVMMPRMDGRTLCHEIRADPALSATRVVFVTAARVNPAECGADGLIRKPFDVDEVVGTVERLLGADQSPGLAPS